MSEEQNTTKQSVMEAIKSGKTEMKSKSHFVVRAIGMLVLTILVALVVIFIFSFAVFLLHRNGVWVAPGFGFRGVLLFIAALPWGLLAIGVIGLLFLEWLLRKYAVVYRRPIVVSLAIILVLAAGIGIAVGKTHLHERLLERAENGRLPLLGPTYRSYEHKPLERVQWGVIVDQQENQWVIETAEGEELELEISERTRIPRDHIFEEGDRIIFVGSVHQGVVEPIGIRDLDDVRWSLRHRGTPPPRILEYR